MITTALKGFCMGTADIIPGISGGTVALILGFYARLVQAIRAFDGAFVGYLYRGKIGAAARHVDLGFLLSLGAGVIGALLFFTRIISLPNLLHAYPEPVYGLFFGLILASIGILIRTLERLNWRDAGWLLFGAMLGYWLVSLTPIHTPETPWFLFLTGTLAICALILPGISGSFVLLVLKKYTYLLSAIATFDVGVLMPFGLGALIGLLLFSRLLTWLLRNFHRLTFLVITGLLIGSLWVIWPFQTHNYPNIEGNAHLISSIPAWPREFDETTMAAFCLMAVGMVTVAVIDSLAKWTQNRK
uniref:Putative membrane protein n=1 Tax=Candidatus Kentrum sp. MB TaxID=2138164 RepID=A0A450XME3_9GAMM|nr:MAG: putative membrane protein [Candidatus Kentron sp. MB]VFK75172.1 MAG: putative membrane protein [Candidatus Kentron sp. MB]